jgi:hypothetical protein
VKSTSSSTWTTAQAADPLGDPEQRQRERDRQPDEPEGERRAPQAVDRNDQLVDDGDGGDGERAPDPDGRLDPVDQRDHDPARRPNAIRAHTYGPALLGERGTELRDDESRRDEEEQAAPPLT